MLTLYGSRGSGSAAAEMVLQACKLPFREVNASRWEAGPSFEELLAINPLGQIPTLLLDDGTVLTESVAIALHLALAHPEARLLPQGPSARALALRGLVFIATNCYAAISIIDYPERWCDDVDAATRARIISAARRQLHCSWDLVADQFGAKPFLNGESPGALDFLAVVVSCWSGSRAHLEKQRPELYRTLLRIQAHPSVEPIFQRHFKTSSEP